MTKAVTLRASDSARAPFEIRNALIADDIFVQLNAGCYSMFQAFDSERRRVYCTSVSAADASVLAALSVSFTPAGSDECACYRRKM